MSAAPSIAVLVMAAGQSRRMGQDKLLLTDDVGQSLLASSIDAALGVGLPVYVALPDNTPKRLAVARERPVTTLICPDAASGMGHSLSNAVSKMPSGLDGIVILLADMPAISTSDICAVLSAFQPDKIARGAGATDAPGHPVLIPACYFDRLKKLTGDQGALAALKDVPRILVQLPDQNAVTDIDTPDDWSAWIDRDSGD